MSLAGSTELHGRGGPAAPARSAFEDACPLCGARLEPAQDWCLRCGAAARTRVAATPRWRAPLVLLLVLAALCLAVLAGALVKLARGSGPTPPALTVIRPAGSAPGTTSTPGATTTPGTTTTPGATTPGTTSTPGASTPGASAPGASTPGAASTPGSNGAAAAG